MGFFDTDNHQEAHQEHDNAYDTNSNNGLVNLEGGSATLAILLVAALAGIPIGVCLWRWVKKDRIRLRAQYPNAYAAYKAERKEDVRELAWGGSWGSGSSKKHDTSGIEWGCSGALEYQPSAPAHPKHWEGPNKERGPVRESKEARANREVRVNREAGSGPEVHRKRGQPKAPATGTGRDLFQPHLVTATAPGVSAAAVIDLQGAVAELKSLMEGLKSKPANTARREIRVDASPLRIDDINIEEFEE